MTFLLTRANSILSNNESGLKGFSVLGFHRYFLLLLVFGFSLGLVSQSLARAPDPQRYTQLELLTDHYKVQAGDVLTLAIEQVIAPHWHTYWKNPGDSGAEPRFTWRVPEGFELGETQWPAPSKIPYGPLMNYGYSDQAVTLHTLKVPEDYDGSPVTVEVDVDILVCADICIPEFETLSVKLNDPNLEIKEIPDRTAFFEEARAALPVKGDVPKARYWVEDGLFNLSVPHHSSDRVVNAYFIPEEWGVVDNAAEPTLAATDFSGMVGQYVTVSQSRGDRAMEEVNEFPVIYVLETEKGVTTYELMAEPREMPAEGVPVVAAVSAASGDVKNTDEAGFATTPLLLVLLGAFAGGLILNLMPCVFPVLSIKALSLVKMAEGHAAEARMHGLAYTAGVVLGFLAVAGILLALQFAGAQIGWGFQLQNPVIVTLLAYLLFIVGLNFAGVFEFSGFSNIGGKAASEGGLTGAFFTGVLATLVATPCTAPFMATAIGVALTQAPAMALLIFAMIGLGLAFPFLLLAFVPAFQRLLPRPGAWMRVFQQFLAFPMFLAVAWLLWVVAKQVEDIQLLGVMVGLILLAFALWIWHFRSLLAKILAVLALIGAVAAGPIMAQPVPKMENMIFGEVFSQERLGQYLDGTDQPVFVEMTAAWCITCKLNHAAALNVESTRELFKAQNVAYLIGDWTNRDDVITAYLKSFERRGVPLYVFYGAPDAEGVRPDPVLLPQILTPMGVEKYILGN